MLLVYIIRYAEILYGLAYYIIPTFISLFMFILFRNYLATVHSIDKDLDILLLALAGIVPSYIVGLFTGYGINILAITPSHIIINVMFFLSYYSLLELLRYLFVKRIGNLNIGTTIAISIITIFFEIPYTKIVVANPRFILEFLSLLATSIVYTVMAARYSLAQLLLVRLSTIFMLKLFPILPNMEWFINIQVMLVSAIFQLSVMYMIFRQRNKVPHSRNIIMPINNRLKPLSLIGKTILISMIVVFSLMLILGYRFLVITSTSMEPTLKVGDLVVVSNSHDISEGDIIAFIIGSKIVIHRVVEVTHESGSMKYYTKGDALDHRDPWKINAGECLGKEILIIPGMGILLVYMIMFFGDYISSIIATITFILALNVIYIARELV